MSRDSDYEIGYGKPPQRTQFKQGQSGNPKGRPKKLKEFEKLMDRELSATIRISEGGQMRTITKGEALVKTVINEALKGDRTTLRIALEFMKSQHNLAGFEPDKADREALVALLHQSTLDGTSMEESGDE